MFTNYLKKNKNSYEVYFKRAVCYYNVHKYKKALYDLSYLIQELDNENNNKEENDDELWAEIYFLRSKAYINMNKIESGLNDINKFFELIEKEKNKIKEKNTKNKNKISNIDVEKILYQKYDISDAHFKRGFCYFNLSEYKKALNEFENAIRLDPNYNTVYNYIKICKRKINKLSEENKKENEEKIDKEKNEI